MAANRSKLQRKTNMLSVYNAFGRNFRLYPCCLSLSSNILTKVILCPLYIHNLSSPKSNFVLFFLISVRSGALSVYVWLVLLLSEVLKEIIGWRLSITLNLEWIGFSTRDALQKPRTGKSTGGIEWFLKIDTDTTPISGDRRVLCSRWKVRKGKPPLSVSAIATRLDIIQGSAYHMIHDMLQYHSVSPRWVPWLLTP